MHFRMDEEATTKRKRTRSSKITSYFSRVFKGHDLLTTSSPPSGERGSCILPLLNLSFLTFPLRFISPPPARSLRLQLKQRKRCAFFRAATRRSVLTRTTTQPHSDRAKESLDA
ncbi:hypothetical protein JOB18_037765 [Solea senegalensis]|uniref:Uncharacterized protein n=1 Tax=Solea senegalensis TaxID=28829 RepID=A0AAV6QEF2_SOLSE|nr:hypothetical protein JOB18_037765 [Solea senegalensis]